MTNRQLYRHQKRTLTMLRHSFATGHRRPFVCSPTGSGKTVVMAAINRGGLLTGNSVLTTVPCVTLIDQTVSLYASEGIHEVGVMQADHPLTNPTMPVQIATLQTLARREMREPGIVLVDEGHINYRTLQN